jgi:uncharacterized protein (TIGR03086 family)
VSTQLADGIGELHLAVCRRFGGAVRAAQEKWNRRSPCDAWDARGVLEHVIGFHDVLLLRPLGLKPDRPRDNPQQRWELTYTQLSKAFDPAINIFERVIDIPTVGNNPATRLDARKLVPGLTRDVLVHTWDLARTIDADDRLDPRWCALFYAELPGDPEALTTSGMFKSPVAVNDDADVQSRLLARLGRDPSWRPVASESS